MSTPKNHRVCQGFSAFWWAGFCFESFYPLCHSVGERELGTAVQLENARFLFRRNMTLRIHVPFKVERGKQIWLILRFLIISWLQTYHKLTISTRTHPANQSIQKAQLRHQHIKVLTHLADESSPMNRGKDHRWWQGKHAEKTLEVSVGFSLAVCFHGGFSVSMLVYWRIWTLLCVVPGCSSLSV